MLFTGGGKNKIQFPAPILAKKKKEGGKEKYKSQKKTQAEQACFPIS